MKTLTIHKCIGCGDFKCRPILPKSGVKCVNCGHNKTQEKEMCREEYCKIFDHHWRRKKVTRQEYCEYHGLDWPKDNPKGMIAYFQVCQICGRKEMNKTDDPPPDLSFEEKSVPIKRESVDRYGNF